MCLEGYYRCALPYRRWKLAQLERAGNAPVMIVFYHRVADTHPNPWTLSRNDFQTQIHWMQRHFELVSLEEAQRRVRSKRNDRACVAITFDDGYAENCQFALPLLRDKQIPCTYFVCTENVARQEPFPHDVARGCPLPVNTVAELREWAAAGVEIGAHTGTHANLGAIQSPQLLHAELVGAAERLQNLLGRAVRYFAFPYGQHEHLQAGAFELAYTSGFEGVCSAYGGYNFPGDDPFHLQRIPGDTAPIYVKNWLMLDARKFRSVRRYQYQYYALPSLIRGAKPAP